MTILSICLQMNLGAKWFQIPILNCKSRTKKLIKFEQKLISRIFTILVLAGITFGLYSTNKAPMPKPETKPESPHQVSINFEEIDRNVDSMLANYGVALKHTRKKKLQDRESDFIRVERQTPTPPNLITLLVTADFHAMAKRYGGRAIASENLKENSVTIHIELEKNIVQSLMFRHAPWVYEVKTKGVERKLNPQGKRKNLKKRKS